MRLLLDTHAFLWWVGDDDRLSKDVREALALADNEVFISVASSWEMAIKVRLGRLNLNEPLEGFVTRQIKLNALSVLPVDLQHTFTLQRLPVHHRDPFDRILIAQALAIDATLVTRDRLIGQYSVPVLW